MALQTIGAIGGLLGGLGQAAGGVAGLFGGGGNNNSYLSYINAHQDREFQRAAMQDGIKWRVNDAKEAGIHPLYALGAPTFSPSPTSINTSSGGADLTPEYLKQMGQGLERAIHSTLTPGERGLDAAGKIMQAQQIERGELSNELLRAQIAAQRALLTGSQVGPPNPAGGGGFSIPGQVSSQSMGNYKVEPSEVKSQAPGTPTSEAGPPAADVKWIKTPTGVRPGISKDSGLSDTDIFNPEYLEWAWRNKVFPNAQRAPSPEYMAKVYPGSIGARWDQFNFEWRPIYPRR